MGNKYQQRFRTKADKERACRVAAAWLDDIAVQNAVNSLDHGWHREKYRIAGWGVSMTVVDLLLTKLTTAMALLK